MITELEKAIYAILTDDPVLYSIVQGKVYNLLAPSYTKVPFIIFSLSSASDDNLTKLHTVQFIYAIKGISNKLEEAQIISDRLGVIFRDRTIILPSYVSFWCFRSSPFAYGEEFGNLLYYHCGGYFQFRFSQ
jgi:hypothetical protein